MPELISSAPFDTTLVPKGVLDADLEALAAEFGTPLFVYDEGELRRRCREYVEHFGVGAVAYAGKSFLCVAMARLVVEEGLHLDVATGGELHVALTAGVDPARIVFHGNNKSDAEVTAGVEAGVGRFVVDSFDELARLERASHLHAGAQRPAVLVRVTPGVEAHTHEFIETGTQASKFGFTVSDGVALDAIGRVVASDAVHFGGIHCHIGSQIERLDAYGRAVEILAELARAVTETTGSVIEELNLGGGLCARYLSGDPEVGVTAYATALHDAVARHWPGPSPRVTIEPGRSIAAPAAVTLYRIGTIKEIPGIGTYVAVDGGMSDNPRPVLYGAGYEAYLPTRTGAARPLRCNVVGKHCEQGDVIVAGAQLPADLSVGDLLVTPTTGAYGYSMASNYNKVPRPAVVFLRDGEARLVVRREDPDDLVRLDVR
jgi:diaminopimelate decarboxylase